MIFTFSGLDGTGKTSHIVATINLLINNGRKCRYFHMIGPKVYPFTFFIRFLQYLTTKADLKEIIKDGINEKPLNPFFKILIIIAIIMDIIVCSTTIFLFYMIGYDSIICDRFFYDFIVDLKNLNLISYRFIPVLLKLSPIPKLSFFLTADIKVIWARKSERSIENLIIRRKYYDFLKNILPFVIIDTTMSFKESQNKINCEILKKF